METKTGYHPVDSIDQFYKLGEVLGDVANIQKALRLAQHAAESAKMNGDWDSFANHIFNCGRLTQGIHYIKDRYNLKILIQDAFSHDGKETRGGFAVVGVSNE